MLFNASLLQFKQSSYLRKCFSEFEACKELSILGILGSDRNASQHEAGDELEIHFDVKPGGGETNVDIWLRCFRLQAYKNYSKYNNVWWDVTDELYQYHNRELKG